MSARRYINDYLDGRLPPRARERFEAEMAADPLLARDVAEVGRVRALLGRLPLEPAPDDLTSRIMAGVREMPIPVRRPKLQLWLLEWARPRRLAWATMAAAVLVAVGAAVRPERARTTLEPVPVSPLVARLDEHDAEFLQQAEREYHLVMAERPAAVAGDAGSIDDVLRDL